MSSVPVQCQRCRHVYGRSHGGTMLICGMHATGPAVVGQCEDFEALHIPSGQYRTSLMLPHQVASESLPDIETADSVIHARLPGYRAAMQRFLARIIQQEESENGPS